MKAIVSKFFGPGNVRGARIKVQAEGVKARFYSYNYSASDAHKSAVDQFCREMNWEGELVDGGMPDGSRVWVFLKGTP